MKYRTRIYYSDAQKALMWDRWQKGDLTLVIDIAFAWYRWDSYEKPGQISRLS